MRNENRGQPPTRFQGSDGQPTTRRGENHALLYFTPRNLLEYKRQKECHIAKLVIAEPLGEITLAMSYKNRPMPRCVSLRPAWLEYARVQGATSWIVRDHNTGVCYGLPLAEVETVGWVKPSQGVLERFIPLTSFRTIPWQTWQYVTDAIRLDDLLSATDEPEHVVDTNKLAAHLRRLRASTPALAGGRG